MNRDADKGARDVIEALRDRIDDLDARLVELLSERAQCALEVGELKRALRVAIYQPARERDVLDHVCALNRGPLDNEAMRRLFERIIDEARRLERADAGTKHAGSNEPTRGRPGTIESED